MSLSKILFESPPEPPRIVMYGDGGVGKSSFAAQAPNPIFLQLEDGLTSIRCHKFPISRTLNDANENLDGLIHEQHDYQTVVIDSLDWLERLIFDALCVEWNVSSVEKVDKGYGKGYTYALTYWREFIYRLDRLRERGMTIVCLAHAKIEKFEDPESSAYDRYFPRLHKNAAALMVEWSDVVLFARKKIITKTEDAGFNRKRTTASGLGNERVMRTSGGPACFAKNRYNLPDELPLSWSALVEAMAAGSEALIESP